MAPLLLLLGCQQCFLLRWASNQHSFNEKKPLCMHVCVFCVCVCVYASIMSGYGGHILFCAAHSCVWSHGAAPPGSPVWRKAAASGSPGRPFSAFRRFLSDFMAARTGERERERERNRKKREGLWAIASDEHYLAVGGSVLCVKNANIYKSREEGWFKTIVLLLPELFHIINISCMYLHRAQDQLNKLASHILYWVTLAKWFMDSFLFFCQNTTFKQTDSDYSHRNFIFFGKGHKENLELVYIVNTMKWFMYSILYFWWQVTVLFDTVQKSM